MPTFQAQSNHASSKRWLRRALLAAAIGSRCSSSRGRPALTVFTWAGPSGQTFERALKPRFEQATGATVLFDNGWGEEIPKLLTAPPDQPPYDVMIVAPYVVYAVIRRGYFLRLDWNKIPNARHFHPSALDNWVAREYWGEVQSLLRNDCEEKGHAVRGKLRL